jgi:hypothetical protein
MTKPVRIQLSRKSGFRLQAHSRSINGLQAVKVDRSTKWGNPFPICPGTTREYSVELFEYLCAGYIACGRAPSIEEQQAILKYWCANIEKLRGMNLACWCKPGDPCHADVLLELADR